MKILNCLKIKKILFDLNQNAVIIFIGYKELMKAWLKYQDFNPEEDISSFSISIDNNTKEYFEVIFQNNMLLKIIFEVSYQFGSTNFPFVHADRY